jgi:hypothetical protein
MRVTTERRVVAYYVRCWLDQPARPLAARAQGRRPSYRACPQLSCLALLLLVVLLFFSLCVAGAWAKLPLLHAACRVAALDDRFRRLASCTVGQTACLVVGRAWVQFCIAAECWPKFFCHSIASSSICFMRFRYMFYLDVACVPSECCICCNGYTHMLQKRDVSNVSAVLDVCCKCFIWMLNMLQ